MHKTVASKDGGINVELSAEEAQIFRDDWAIAEAKQKEEEAEAKRQKDLCESACNKLFAGLTPEEAAAMKKDLGL